MTHCIQLRNCQLQSVLERMRVSFNMQPNIVNILDESLMEVVTVLSWQ